MRQGQIINPTLKITFFNDSILLSRNVYSHHKQDAIARKEEVVFGCLFCFLAVHKDFICPPLIQQTIRICSLLQPVAFIFLLKPSRSRAAAHCQDLSQRFQSKSISPTLFERICFGKLVSLTKLMSA